MPVTTQPSPEYGKRLIPQIVDNLALVDPDRVVYSIASFSDASHQFQHITAREFTKAIDKTAWWLRGLIGKPTSIQAVGYIGPRKCAESTSSSIYCFSASADRNKMILDMCS